MQLASLALRNFQAHKHMDLTLSPITTIKGPSDAGKSAILRALRWACLNDFSGEDFIREGADGALVIVSTKEGNRIERGKGKPDGNVYRLDGEELKAFGQGVPEPVQRALKLSELNFQGQHDAPFWFSLSGPEVSRQLNAIIDLTVIDTTLSNIANLVRTARERVNFSKERITELEKSLEEQVPQRARIAEFEHLQEWSVRLDKRTKRHERLERLLKNVEETNVERLRQRHQDSDTLFEGAQRLFRLDKRIEALESLLQQRDHLLLQHNPPPDFSKLDEMKAKLNQQCLWVEQLTDLLKEIDERQNEASVRADEYKGLHGRFEEKIKGTKCPLCGQPLPKPHTI